ncbi:MAG: 2-amino-4-hydroxy-6-hydroxymethyldihydropteridine diphosphokinase [Actinomycetes bacterium]
MRAVISLGSNIGDKFSYLQSAVNEINELSDSEILICSSVYKTKPVVFEDQEDFLNAVLILETAFSAEELLMKLLIIELNLGRERSIKWGPRTIDLDLIDYEKIVINSEKLTLPHPRAIERCFVLKPWNEIDDNAEIAVHGKIKEILQKIDCSDVDIYPSKLVIL